MPGLISESPPGNLFRTASTRTLDQASTGIQYSIATAPKFLTKRIKIDDQVYTLYLEAVDLKTIRDDSRYCNTWRNSVDRLIQVRGS